MQQIDRVIWLIEANINNDFDLDKIAKEAGVSKFHLCRQFLNVTGISIMKYARLRKLSLAAKRLILGEKIINIAIDFNYGSPEAFSRAFMSAFGISPKEAKNNIDKIKFMEAFQMDNSKFLDLKEPTTIILEPKIFCGVSGFVNPEDTAKIPSLWADFGEKFHLIENICSQGAYGICYNNTENGEFDYLCSLEISKPINKDGLTILKTQKQKYLKFEYSGHISQVRNVFKTIFGKILPELNVQTINAPILEYYPPSFNARTGEGGFSILIPV